MTLSTTTLIFAVPGGEPEKPYSGQFVLRVAKQLHRDLVHAAEARKTSLNALIEGDARGHFLDFRGRKKGAQGENVLSTSAAAGGAAPGLENFEHLKAGKTAGVVAGRRRAKSRR